MVADVKIDFTGMEFRNGGAENPSKKIENGKNDFAFSFGQLEAY